MRKIIKTTILGAIVGTLISYSALKFIYYQMDKELITYLILQEKSKNISDIYALCDGLLTTNPTKENQQTCDEIIMQVKKIDYEIKQKCPYISFYTTYIQKLQ